MSEQPEQTWVEEITDPVTGEIIRVTAQTEEELDRKVGQIFPQEDEQANG